nr:MAG TPA: hypothetical protein [Caudoviricetes sp.]
MLKESQDFSWFSFFYFFLRKRFRSFSFFYF